MGRLEGKVALITGGARGIGEAHVRRFTAEGARVILGDIRDEQGAALASATGATYVHLDVANAHDWAHAIDVTLNTHGTLNVLVNNAGVLQHRSISDMTEADLRHILDINLVGHWLGIKAVIEPMKAAGGGSIINTSSTEGYAGAAGRSAYSASKFAIRGITKAAAQELGRFGIRANSLHPGAIVTPLTTDPELTADVGLDIDGFIASLPLARWGQPEDVAGAAIFLASDESAYCTGTEILVDGGMLSGPGC
ncbi:glucose 1-dehydrogenase [Nonomuraea sp. NPDC005650]|uniref:SDR family NAD(P)-dependent oxidoreductase n=1 Tax=Nonomuraea sp. NPDC005650 TaxID=3157045 RepID=UPI0033AE681B